MAFCHHFQNLGMDFPPFPLASGFGFPIRYSLPLLELEGGINGSWKESGLLSLTPKTKNHQPPRANPLQSPDPPIPITKPPTFFMSYPIPFLHSTKPRVKNSLIPLSMSASSLENVIIIINIQ
jgi:hypothetical protein